MNPRIDLENEDGFSQWAIVELMGHKRVAGKVTKETTFGSPLLRIDVPANEQFPAFTQYYGVPAIYCMTPVSEEVAKIVSAQMKIDPVSIYAPELVTREKFDATIKEYREHLERAQRGLLPPHSKRIKSNQIETWEDPDDDDQMEMG